MLKKNIQLLIFSFGIILAGNAQIITDKQGSSSGSGSVIDEIIAQVGDLPVLRSDLEAQKAQLQGEGMTVDETTSCTILEELLYQNLRSEERRVGKECRSRMAWDA